MLKVSLVLKVEKLNSSLALVLLNLNKFLNLAKNIILLFLFLSLIILISILLITLLFWFLDKVDKIFTTPINSLAILIKL